jgi:hypothetical protein
MSFFSGHERFDQLAWHELDLVTEFNKATGPVLRPSASFHAN